MWRLFLIIGITCIATLAPLNAYAVSKQQEAVNEQQEKEKEEITTFLQQLYKDRNTYLVNRLPETINKYYVLNIGASRHAYQMELKRSQYIHSWADKRGIRLTEAKADLRIARIKDEGGLAKVSLVQSAKISYNYKGLHLPSQSFGVGTRHALTVKKIDGHWKVMREWYLDPLEENPDLIPDSPAGFPHPSADSDSVQANKKGTKYNRERAVAYANKYAGLAWGAGNNNRYNRKYKDYTSLGGDCTNFVSQVLGDTKEGGGLRMSGAWGYSGGGSQAWVQTDAFKNYLLYFGYGRQIAKGDFVEVTRSSEKYPEGAISKLQPGDLIGYILEGDVDHFSVITGHDANGYPLVNSHTADRYRVPFDLGWDKTTKYILIHIND